MYLCTCTCVFDLNVCCAILAQRKPNIFSDPRISKAFSDCKNNPLAFCFKSLFNVSETYLMHAALELINFHFKYSFYFTVCHCGKSDTNAVYLSPAETFQFPTVINRVRIATQKECREAMLSGRCRSRGRELDKAVYSSLEEEKEADNTLSRTSFVYFKSCIIFTGLQHSRDIRSNPYTIVEFIGNFCQLFILTRKSYF